MIRQAIQAAKVAEAQEKLLEFCDFIASQKDELGLLMARLYQ